MAAKKKTGKRKVRVQQPAPRADAVGQIVISGESVTVRVQNRWAPRQPAAGPRRG